MATTATSGGTATTGDEEAANRRMQEVNRNRAVLKAFVDGIRVDLKRLTLGE